MTDPKTKAKEALDDPLLAPVIKLMLESVAEVVRIQTARRIGERAIAIVVDHRHAMGLDHGRSMIEKLTAITQAEINPDAEAEKRLDSELHEGLADLFGKFWRETGV